MAKKETTCSRIQQSWLAINRMYNNEAVKHELTTTMGFVLLNIDTKKGTPSTLISQLMGMETGSLTRTLNTLELKGIVKRKKDKTDARIVRIMLTKKGKKKRDVSVKTVKEFNKIIANKYSESEMEKFNNMVMDIAAIAIETKFNNS